MHFYKAFYQRFCNCGSLSCSASAEQCWNGKEMLKLNSHSPSSTEAWKSRGWGKDHMKRNTTCYNDLCTLFLNVQGNVRPPRVLLGFKGWYARRSIDRAQKRLRNHQSRKSLTYHLGAMRFKMQIPTLGSHSASLASGVMQSFSKGAGSSSGGSGIYFHSVAAAQHVLNKLCMRHGLFQKSLPGQSLAFHLHLMATFLTFHLLQVFSLGRCLFPSRAGGQGAHSRGGGTEVTLPLGCWRPLVLPMAFSGLLCTEGSVLVDTFQLYSSPELPQYYHVKSPQPHVLARGTPVPEVQRGFARAWLANNLLISNNFWMSKCLRK